MALIDDKPRILAALAAIPGLADALPAWPQDWARLPCITVSEASNRPADQRDDREYITKLEYYVRVFSARAEELARIADAADDVMLGLGYTRTMVYDDDNPDVRQKAMRYVIHR